jgi:hypothetical protein
VSVLTIEQSLDESYEARNNIQSCRSGIVGGAEMLPHESSEKQSSRQQAFERHCQGELGLESERLQIV